MRVKAAVKPSGIPFSVRSNTAAVKVGGDPPSPSQRSSNQRRTLTGIFPCSPTGMAAAESDLRPLPSSSERASAAAAESPALPLNGLPMGPQHGHLFLVEVILESSHALPIVHLRHRSNVPIPIIYLSLEKPKSSKGLSISVSMPESHALPMNSEIVPTIKISDVSVARTSLVSIEFTELIQLVSTTETYVSIPINSYPSIGKLFAATCM
nr:hypothetical protein Iba_chr12eCG7080 [Ipomoea batatas]